MTTAQGRTRRRKKTSQAMGLRRERNGRRKRKRRQEGRNARQEDPERRHGLRISDEKIKLQRAQGGCHGAIRRRRTRPAAKSFGELQASIDPEISEWGNPARGMPGHPQMNT